jgi:hypothetical protein
MASVGTVLIADVKCADHHHLLWSMPAEARRNFDANAWSDIAAMDDPAVADVIDEMARLIKRNREHRDQYLDFVVVHHSPPDGL